MKKISFWISGICFVVSFIIFSLVISSSSSSSNSENWAILSTFIACLIGILTFLLSYMGGHIIRKTIGAIRLGVIISALWIVISFLSFNPYQYRHAFIISGRRHDWTDFLLMGIVTVFFYWGILWVISGFLPSKPKKINS